MAQRLFKLDSNKNTKEKLKEGFKLDVCLHQALINSRTGSFGLFTPWNVCSGSVSLFRYVQNKFKSCKNLDSTQCQENKRWVLIVVGGVDKKGNEEGNPIRDFNVPPHLEFTIWPGHRAAFTIRYKPFRIFMALSRISIHIHRIIYPGWETGAEAYDDLFRQISP